MKATVLTQFIVLGVILFVALSLLFYRHRQIMNVTRKAQNSLSNNKKHLVKLFNKALTQREFILLYQPKISVKTGKICSAEALIRWHNPNLGWISPEQFIPLAEETGLIVPLGQWVIRSACEEVMIWHELGFNDLQVAINLSAQQFRIGDLVQDIAIILQELGLSPRALEVELTESVFLENTEKNILMLRVLKAMGVTISLDDFGTGYSSLKYLRQFPLDALKIDKCFVENICKDEEDTSIIKAMVALAKALNMKTIAEGVETLEQIKYLAELEVDELQGYYYNRPLTSVEFIAELQKERQSVEDSIQSS